MEKYSFEIYTYIGGKEVTLFKGDNHFSGYDKDKIESMAASYAFGAKCYAKATGAGYREIWYRVSSDEAAVRQGKY